MAPLITSCQVRKDTRLSLSSVVHILKWKSLGTRLPPLSDLLGVSIPRLTTPLVHIVSLNDIPQLNEWYTQWDRVCKCHVCTHLYAPIQSAMVMNVKIIVENAPVIQPHIAMPIVTTASARSYGYSVIASEPWGLLVSVMLIEQNAPYSGHELECGDFSGSRECTCLTQTHVAMPTIPPMDNIYNYIWPLRFSGISTHIIIIIVQPDPYTPHSSPRVMN